MFNKNDLFAKGTKWKKFHLVKTYSSKGKTSVIHDDGLFDLSSTKSGIDNNKLVKGDGPENYNLITRTDKNNGISRKVCKQKYDLNSPFSITIGLDTQTVFWQEQSYYTGQNINILSSEKFKNKYLALFICAILKKTIKNDFSWGNTGATIGRLKDYVIELPVDAEDIPAWKEMSKTMKDMYSFMESKLPIVKNQISQFMDGIEK